MWGLILAVVAIAIATDGELRLKKLQNRLFDVELALSEVRKRLDARAD